MTKSLKTYLAKHKKRLAWGLSVKVLSTIAELLLPLVMAHLIDNIAPLKDYVLVLLWGSVMLLFAVIAWIGNVVANRSASKIARDVTENLRNDLFESTLKLSASQQDMVTVPSLVSRLSSDTYNVHNMIGMMQRLGVRAPLLLIGGVALTFTVEPVLACVLLAVVPLLTLIVIFISSRGVRLYTALQKSTDGMVRKVRDDYTLIRVIKALSRTEHENRQFDIINKDVVKHEQRAGMVMGASNPLLSMFLYLGMTATVLIGAYRVNAGHALPGAIIAFTSYFTVILNAVISVSRIFVNLTKGTASAKRICEILNSSSPLTVLPAQEAEQNCLCRFDNVTFSYNGNPAIKNLSFTLERGQSLGIIGATGSGKSTVVALLLRLYDPDSGNIYIDGKDIRSYTPEQLRSRIGVVLQNDFLATVSVADNIRFKRDISDDEIVQSAKYAGAHDFITAKEQGYDTMLTSKGANFSGGQKQRILIARALAGDPEMLILDDSSSALDYRTDAQLRRTLLDNFPDTAIVMVAQRISSIRFADKILVMKEGRSVGFGTDSQLMQQCPEYREIYLSQTESGGEQ